MDPVGENCETDGLIGRKRSGSASLNSDSLDYDVKARASRLRTKRPRPISPSKSGARNHRLVESLRAIVVGLSEVKSKLPAICRPAGWRRRRAAAEVSEIERLKRALDA